jgi:UDP-N-acetylmuramate-alanine ligase
LSQFAVCFDGADEVVFAPIFGAREQGDDSIIDKLVASVKQKMPVKLSSSYEQICDYLVTNVKSGERIVIVGAGSIDKLSRLFLETT